ERPMRFPSLMFLQRVTITTARRRRITDWPLLLARATIITLAVLAFARPVLRPRPDAVPTRGARRVVLVLDRSMSMGHRAVWPVALDSARAIIGALPPGDRVAVVSFDDEAAIEQPLTLDRAAALAAVDRVHPGSRGTRFGAGIRAARDLLAREVDASGGEILVVTDLQRNGAIGIAGLSLSPTVRLRVINVAGQRHGNAAVASIDVQRIAGSDGVPNRLAVSAELAVAARPRAGTVHVTLSANGRPSGARDVRLPTDGSASVTFDPVALPLGVLRVVVAIDHDSLPADDVFNAVVPAELIRRVIVAVPGDLAPDEMLYLERALETGHNPAWRVERRSPATLDATSLRDAVAVLLYDVAPPSGTNGAPLAAWVRAGGGLVSVAGRRTATRLTATGLLPGSTHGMVDRTADRGAVLGAASLEHP
ncbi:MAG: vWA domain-containing protein, partial [Gemmatimonadales bacterium]